MPVSNGMPESACDYANPSDWKRIFPEQTGDQSVSKTQLGHAQHAMPSTRATIWESQHGMPGLAPTEEERHGRHATPSPVLEPSRSRKSGGIAGGNKKVKG